MRISRFLSMLAILCGSTGSALAEDGIIVLVDVKIKPGNAEAVLAGFKRSQERCKEWSGCRRFDITVDEGISEQMIIIEHWDSIDSHRREVEKTTGSETFADFRQLLADDLKFRYLRLQ